MKQKLSERYTKHIQLKEIGLTGQKNIQNTNVLVIGCGGIGSPTLLYLVHAGLKNLGIVDFDRVELSNLQRQVLFSNKDVGKNKSECAKENLLQKNPDISVENYVLRVNKTNLTELITNYNIIVDATDNYETRYLINETCINLNKPLVYGSIQKTSGQVTVFNYLNGPNLNDLFPEKISVKQNKENPDNGILNTLTGVTGAMMATEVIKIICNDNNVLSGKLAIFDIWNNRYKVLNY